MDYEEESNSREKIIELYKVSLNFECPQTENF